MRYGLWRLVIAHAFSLQWYDVYSLTTAWDGGHGDSLHFQRASRVCAVSHRFDGNSCTCVYSTEACVAIIGLSLRSVVHS